MATFTIGELHGNTVSVTAYPAGQSCVLALYLATDAAGQQVVQLTNGMSAIFYSAAFQSQGIAQPVLIPVDTTNIPAGTYYAFIVGYMNTVPTVVQPQSEKVTVSTAGINLGGDTVSTQNVVTSQRYIGTTYQNNTGKPMFVSVSPNASMNMLPCTDSNPIPNTLVAFSTSTFNVAYVPVFFIVLPGNYYRVAATDQYGGNIQAGTYLAALWTEWY